MKSVTKISELIIDIEFALEAKDQGERKDIELREELEDLVAELNDLIVNK
jgi:hypothetical protein